MVCTIYIHTFMWTLMLLVIKLSIDRLSKYKTMRTSLLRPLIVSFSFINKISKHYFNKYANSCSFILISNSMAKEI